MEIVRDKFLTKEILFIDGSWGTGKSILGPVLGSYSRVEKQKIDHIFEYTAIFDFLGRMDKGASHALLNIYADLDLFNMMISREVNLRWSDDSGIKNNPKIFEYLKRLFADGGDDVKQRVIEDRPILQIMSHHLLHVADAIFRSYGDRVRFVEMVRHPVYMISHWYNYLHRLGQDEREFTIWLKGKDGILPWFIFENEDEFTRLNRMDRVIYSLVKVDALLEKSLQRNHVHNDQIFFVPFERFVTDPEPYVKKLGTFLKDDPMPVMDSVLKKQKCPRKMLSDGLGHKSYGWSNNSHLTDEQDFSRRLDFVRAEASPVWVQKLSELSAKYEAKYDLKGIGPFN